MCFGLYLAEIRRQKNCPVTTGWEFPMSRKDTMKYRVFSYFWEKGYFLTGGGKFGGDFLIYPGLLITFCVSVYTVSRFVSRR